MSTMTLAKFKEEVKDGKFFSVEFIKADGTNRKMTCRRGVFKGVKGVLPEGHRAAEDDRNQVLTVYDVNKLTPEMIASGEVKGAFRRINLKTLIHLNLHGRRYSWSEDGCQFVEIGADA